MAEQKIIKARDLESSGASVEKVDLGLRKFANNVFKNVPLDEEPVAMEVEAPVPDSPGEEGIDGADGDEHQVRIERFYNDDGELTGLQITCRCGEVIDLEFTRDEDETLPESSPQVSGPEIEQTDSVEEAAVEEGEEAEEQELPEQVQNAVEEDTAQEMEDSEQEIEEKADEDQILVDNEQETTEIEEN